LQGTHIAPTPEALMRSRYSAYTLRAFDYIENTMRAKPLRHFDRDATEKSGHDIAWDKLEVLEAFPVSATDTQGFVEFKAYYHTPQGSAYIYEKSRFIKLKERWYYVEGIDKPKLSRNSQCPCNSGRKYKKCCGA